jgi:hypothetical protein
MAKDIKKQKTNTLMIFDIVVPISNWLPTKDVYHGDLNYRTTRLPHNAFAGLNTTTCNYWMDVSGTFSNSAPTRDSLGFWSVWIRT